jgi:hypothetical protein
MPGNRFNGFTNYGIGIGLRAPYYEHILSPKPGVGSDVGNSGLLLPPGGNKCAATKLREKSKDLDHE